MIAVVQQVLHALYADVALTVAAAGSAERVEETSREGLARIVQEPFEAFEGKLLPPAPGWEVSQRFQAKQSRAALLLELFGQTIAHIDLAPSRLALLARDRELDDHLHLRPEVGPIFSVRRCFAHLPCDERRRWGAKGRNDGREQCARAEERSTRSAGARRVSITLGFVQ